MSQSINIRDGLSIVLHEKIPVAKNTVQKTEHIITSSEEGCTITQSKDGEVLHIVIEKDACLDKPIIISSHYHSFGRYSIQVQAKEGSTASINRFILEIRGDQTKGMIEENIEVHVEKGATLYYNERTEINQNTIWTSKKDAQNKGTLKIYTHGEEGQLLSQEIETHLSEKESAVEVLHTGKIKHSASTKIINRHETAETTSSMKSRNVVSGKMIHSGLVRIEENACESAGEQHSNTLIVGEGVADSHPQLEIENAEVSCSHGSTTGHIEEEALFYLQSRGMDRADAEHMIVQGHLHSITEETQDTHWKADILSLLNARKQDLICLKCSLSRIKEHKEVHCTCN